MFTQHACRGWGTFLFVSPFLIDSCFRLAGLQAFRDSPVFTSHLNIGRWGLQTPTVLDLHGFWGSGPHLHDCTASTVPTGSSPKPLPEVVLWEAPPTTEKKKFLEKNFMCLWTVLKEISLGACQNTHTVVCDFRNPQTCLCPLLGRVPCFLSLFHKIL